ncbi:MAG TPA: Holliday junction resolvase RuvX [Proteobacteria bacterium]|nr:putative Holliday junction resolvase [bacterium BMS3Abin14]HDL53685.1 Holliday junction resolvase RuvX [Pseudomonadota bacterium]
MVRILGIDWGERRVGVALSDESRTIASPHSVIVRSPSINKDLGRILKLVGEHDVACVVVGNPITMDGTQGPAADKVEKIVGKLRNLLDVPVVTWDERLSTAEAQKVLIDGDVSRRKRKKIVDRVAAALILQTYLDSGSWREN